MGAVVLAYVAMILPRPWIWHVAALLVANLHEDLSKSSAAQSFAQGGFALGSVVILLRNQLSSKRFGPEATCIIGAVSLVMSAVFFVSQCLTATTRRTASRPPSRRVSGSRLSKWPCSFTLACCLLACLAAAVGGPAGDMHPEFLRDLKFDVTASAACQVTFYTFLALSRMVLAPSILWCYDVRPSSVIMAGSGLALLSCIPALIWPTHLLAVLVLVAGLGTGVGPIEAMCISMIKKYKELTSIDMALLCVSLTLGAGAGSLPAVAGIIPGLGAGSVFLVKHVMCWLLLVVTLIVDRCFLQNDAEVSGGDGCTDSPQKESGEAHDSRV